MESELDDINAALKKTKSKVNARVLLARRRGLLNKYYGKGVGQLIDHPIQPLQPPPPQRRRAGYIYNAPIPKR